MRFASSDGKSLCTNRDNLVEGVQMIERREFGKTLVGGMVSTSTVADVAIAAEKERRARGQESSDTRRS